LFQKGEINMRLLTKLAFALATVTAAAPAMAQVVLEGNYIRVGVGREGTLGVGGNTSPGLIHDPSGTGSFNPSTDYITPGSPHEGFSLVSDQFSFGYNDNYGGGSFGNSAPTLLTGAAANGYANAASWSGGNSFLNISNSYFFNDGDERILVVTTITALSNLSNLAFARSVDPDSGTTTSINQRGNSLFGVNDFVGSASASNGRTLALVNLNGDALEHTTQINESCCSNINPYNVLSHTGGDLGLTSTGDHGLNLGYRIGTLSAGNSVTLNYAYAVGTRIDVVGGTPGAVPEPATWAMMIAGFGVAGGALRRRRREERVAIA
jgi:hypothetical protein